MRIVWWVNRQNYGGFCGAPLLLNCACHMSLTVFAAWHNRW